MCVCVVQAAARSSGSNKNNNNKYKSRQHQKAHRQVVLVGTLLTQRPCKIIHLNNQSPALPSCRVLDVRVVPRPTAAKRNNTKPPPAPAPQHKKSSSSPSFGAGDSMLIAKDGSSARFITDIDAYNKLVGYVDVDSDSDVDVSNSCVSPWLAVS
jgi:hypothetical protein